jgi:hypothetical protein
MVLLRDDLLLDTLPRLSRMHVRARWPLASLNSSGSVLGDHQHDGATLVVARTVAFDVLGFHRHGA